MFIPNEVKKKIEELEEENKSLKSEIGSLSDNAIEIPQENKSFKGAFIISFALLIICLGYIYYVYEYKVGVSEEEVPEYTLQSNGEVIPLSTFADSGIVFRVQVGAFEGFSLEDYKGGLDAIKQDSLVSVNKISLGGFTDVDVAIAFQEDMIRLGFENAYLVAYKDNEPIMLLEAIKNSLPTD